MRKQNEIPRHFQAFLLHVRDHVSCSIHTYAVKTAPITGIYQTKNDNKNANEVTNKKFCVYAYSVNYSAIFNVQELL